MFQETLNIHFLEDHFAYSNSFMAISFQNRNVTASLTS